MFTRHRFYLVAAVAVLALLVAGCGLTTSTSPSAASNPAPSQALAAQEGSESMPRTVTVQGSGSASAAPDVAHVRLGVETVDTDADAAVQDNTERMTAVMDAIREMGVAETDIQTTQFNMSIIEERDEGGQLTGVIRFRVRNQVRVTLRDISQTGELLQAALSAGANTVEGISFDIDDSQALETEARDQAIANAKEKAQQLASGLDAELGSVRQIREFGGSPRPVVEMERAAAAARDVPISGGELSVSVQIEVVFDLQ